MNNRNGEGEEVLRGAEKKQNMTRVLVVEAAVKKKENIKYMSPHKNILTHNNKYYYLPIQTLKSINMKTLSSTNNEASYSDIYNIVNYHCCNIVVTKQLILRLTVIN